MRANSRNAWPGISRSKYPRAASKYRKQRALRRFHRQERVVGGNVDGESSWGSSKIGMERRRGCCPRAGGNRSHSVLPHRTISEPRYRHITPRDTTVASATGPETDTTRAITQRLFFDHPASAPIHKPSNAGRKSCGLPQPEGLTSPTSPVLPTP